MTKNNLKVVKSTKDQEADNKEKNKALDAAIAQITDNFGKGSVMKLCLLYTSPSPRDGQISRMPSSA